ncbi:hypothetical protein EXIGLDRAFT_731712 [Exidia glandulosa HHB12029]|uniref:Uncharacterized protein n=1 Tax=Exidia glandulosa HHB12029 TaxID=1314781 RepID=A0A165BRW8_EXIGL|nr:hypothetical protein EXIGLDRAFT_731712 [Exidia glandulosa HHB12029]
MCLLITKCDDPKRPRLEPSEHAVRLAKPDGRRAARRAPPSATAATFTATAAMFADTLPPVVGCGCIWMASEDDPTWPCPQHILLHSSLLTRALLPLPTTRRTPASPPTSRPSRLIDALDLDALTYDWLPKLPAFSIVEAIDKYAVAVRDDPTAYEPVPQTKYPTCKQISSVQAAMVDEIRDEYLAAMVWAKDSGALWRRPKRDSDPATTYNTLRKERADEEAHLKEWSYFFADPVKPPLIAIENVDDWYDKMDIHDEATPGTSSVGRNVQFSKNRLPFPNAPLIQAPSTLTPAKLTGTTAASASRASKRAREDDVDEPNMGLVARADHPQVATPPNATGQGIGSASASHVPEQTVVRAAPAVPSPVARVAVHRARGLRAPPNPGEPHEQVERFCNEQYPCTRFAPKEWTLYCDPCWQDPTRRAQWHNEKSLENHKKRCQAAPLPPGLQNA